MSTPGIPRSGSSRPRTPVWTLVAAAALVGVEAAALVVLGGYAMVATLTGTPANRSAALLGGGLAVLAGAGLAGAAWGLLGARRWARSPALVWQLIMLPVGYYQIGPQPVIGVPVVAVALVTIGLLFVPRTGAALSG